MAKLVDLSNLEMKHVGKLAIIGALLKDVKTSCGRTMQGWEIGHIRYINVLTWFRGYRVKLL